MYVPINICQLSDASLPSSNDWNLIVETAHSTGMLGGGRQISDQNQLNMPLPPAPLSRWQPFLKRNCRSCEISLLWHLRHMQTATITQVFPVSAKELWDLIGDFGDTGK